MFLNRPVSLALVGLFLWVTGCQSYKHVEPPFAGHDQIRVTTVDGQDWTLSEPRVEADSLMGRIEQHGWVSIPLNRVADTWVGGTDEAGTIGVIVLVLAVAAAGLFVAAALSASSIGNH